MVQGQTYSIKDLEQLSGIKAHTLRIWEQRYSFIKPKRTTTNIRYYNNEDLKLVLNISLLRENGYKISRIAEMKVEEIAEEVRRFTEETCKYPEQMHSLTLAMLDLDEERFEKTISTCILQIGFEKTMLTLVYPFLSRIGVLWQTGAAHPVHEHFMSALIRQKIIVAIDGQYPSKNEKKKKFFLFLPEGELHEIGLLFASYVLKARNHTVVYLGQSLPFQDLITVHNLHRPDYLMTIITSAFEQNQVQHYINKLSAAFPEATILISGHQVVAQDIVLPENVELFQSKENFFGFLEEI